MGTDIICFLTIAVLIDPGITDVYNNTMTFFAEPFNNTQNLLPMEEPVWEK